MNKFLPLLLFFIPFFTKISAQCNLQIQNCQAAIQGCDYTPNDPLYWNDANWWDPTLSLHDLAEWEIDLNLTVADICPTTVRCLLFLDTDGDGMQETVVDSDNPPVSGTVNFGNANNPNYSGGIPRPIDQRVVPANQKWHFAVKSVVSGDTSSFSLQWANEIAPSVFKLPELPYGVHKVRWIVTNSSGAMQVCEKTFVVKDCKRPTVVCINGLSVNVMPTQMIQLWATDFLQYASDNATPTPLLKLGIRKSGTGSGFPVDASGNPLTSVSFTCSELGIQGVELWAIDAAGNADFCETYVIVQDNLGVCGDPPSTVEACVSNNCGLDPEEVTFEFSVFTGPGVPPLSYFDLGSPCGSLNLPLPPNSEVVITPSFDDNPLNGVSSFDPVLIQKHIDGTDLFDTPYQWIAADANNDHVIDTLDIIECRKLILGIYTELPNNDSWRFVDKSYVFPSPDPLSVPFPESVTVNSGNPPALSPEFIGVKICDVSCGNLVGFYDLEPEGGHLIGLPEPNPTSEGALLPLQLLGPETVQLEVLDFSGRLLFRLESALPGGAALLEIPASAMPQAGVYAWRVRAGDASRTGKLVRY